MSQPEALKPADIATFVTDDTTVNVFEVLAALRLVIVKESAVRRLCLCLAHDVVLVDADQRAFGDAMPSYSVLWHQASVTKFECNSRSCL
jgi:hypothetical protein